MFFDGILSGWISRRYLDQGLGIGFGLGKLLYLSFFVVNIDLGLCISGRDFGIGVQVCTLLEADSRHLTWLTVKVIDFRLFGVIPLR